MRCCGGAERVKWIDVVRHPEAAERLEARAGAQQTRDVCGFVVGVAGD